VHARTICLMLSVLASSRSTASADEFVKFDTAPLIMGQIQQRQVRERGETAVNAPDAIEGYLAKPDGRGPFPAIVYLHGCSGLSKATRTRIAELMTGWGYVSLTVDSFASRGIEQACERVTVEQQAVMPTRQADALGALTYLSKLPFVDGTRVAVVGSSQGGMVALQLASTRSAEMFAVPDGLTFKAAVAYYPMCEVASDELTIPTAILIGQLDDWSPAKDCERLMQRRAGNGAPVKLIIYPGAYHAFDAPILNEGRWLLGHWLKYDADAAAHSIVDMHDFLAAELNK